MPWANRVAQKLTRKNWLKVKATPICVLFFIWGGGYGGVFGGGVCASVCMFLFLFLSFINLLCVLIVIHSYGLIFFSLPSSIFRHFHETSSTERKVHSWHGLTNRGRWGVWISKIGLGSLVGTCKSEWHVFQKSYNIRRQIFVIVNSLFSLVPSVVSFDDVIVFVLPP